MTRPVIIPAAGVFIGLAECAAIRHGAVRNLNEAIRNGEQVPADLRETIRVMDAVGAGWAKKLEAGLSSDLSSLSSFASQPFVRVEWESMTTKTAAGELGITPQAVGQLLTSATLHGEKLGRTWRVCSESVTARKEGTTCQHQSK